MPLTLFCVYCTTSENKNANAEVETSVVRVLFKLRSNMFGLGPACFVEVDPAVLTEGNENLVVLVAGESASADEREDVDMTENRGCCC